MLCVYLENLTTIYVIILTNTTKNILVLNILKLIFMTSIFRRESHSKIYVHIYPMNLKPRFAFR